MALAAATGPHQLVVQTSFLGDTVLTTPLIAELAKRGPVSVVVTPASAPLLARNPDIHQIFVYDKRGADAGLLGFRRLALQLRAPQPREGAPPAIAYLAQRSARSGALALAGGYTQRVGFEGSAGQTLYSRRVPYREDRHHAERLWRLAFPDVDTKAPELMAGAPKFREPSERSTSMATPATTPWCARMMSSVSCTRPPRVTTSSATMKRSLGAISKPRRKTSPPASFSAKMCRLPSARPTSCPTTIPPSAGEMTASQGNARSLSANCPQTSAAIPVC